MDFAQIVRRNKQKKAEDPLAYRLEVWTYHKLFSSMLQCREYSVLVTPDRDTAGIPLFDLDKSDLTAYESSVKNTLQGNKHIDTRQKFNELSHRVRSDVLYKASAG
ncbi:hypothetical protein BGZ68_010243 [Mortierella alpina]|nr:hypothetical protein BGZ68_010243 [Mortierella alpina]